MLMVHEDATLTSETHVQARGSIAFCRKNFKNDDGQKLLISRPLKQKIVMFNFSTSRTFKKVLFSISFKLFLYHAYV